MDVWQAVLLGVIQGLTEFLPISSTAHLLVARQLLGHPYPEDAFTVVIQLGTLAAVFAYFRADIARLAKGFVTDLRNGTVGATPDGRMAWLIVLGTVPAVLVGFTLKTWLKATFYNLPSVAVVSIVFAVLMLAAEWWARRRTVRGLPPRGGADVGWRDALWVGAWQALALMPGGSRSGTTITGGLFAGLTRPAAARFSFLLSLPVILGAGMKELYDEYKKLNSPHGSVEPGSTRQVAGEPASLFASGDEVVALVTGTVVAAVVGYFAIAVLLRFLQRYTTAVFVAYRLLMGVAILGLLGLNAI